jgi:hypothetical protein
MENDKWKMKNEKWKMENETLVDTKYNIENLK